ncbi:MAG: UvrD-helicase domain-containing protein [Chloroflexi bacterium]|nr:UvrD-helicase domain-containing protein [Chloroflexota bacterium]
MTITVAPKMSDADSLSVIQSDLDSSIYVEAGAGTGKTHSLVQRIVALLEEGVEIEEIIAITFTRAAASELRSRIRGELEQLRVANPSDQRIKTALDGIDTAAFQTIDSLVYSILREHPLDADLPPMIEVQQKFAELQVFRDRWRQWSVERLEDDQRFPQALSAAMRLELRSPFASVSDLAKTINENHGEMSHAVFPKPQRVGIATVEILAASIARLQELMILCRSDSDSLYVKIERVVDWYTTTLASRNLTSEDEAEAILASWPSTTSSGGTIKNWGREGKADAADALQSVIDAINEALMTAREAVTAELFKYAADFVVAVVEERRRAGTVSYYDAVTWLIDMLEKHDDIRRRLQRRYRRILVDEFQDTDPKQVRLVRLLTIPPGAQDIKPGSLFVVGDPKQSIYRFRGAQVEVSQGVKTEIANAEAGGKYLNLRENRRSTRPVINWVNHVFGSWMPSEAGQADYVPLDVASDTAAPDTFGSVYHFGETMEDVNLPEVRQEDAKEVAIIARAVCAGALEVRVRQSGDTRPSRPGDLTILTRARSNWETYTRQLNELNLPYTAEIGGAAVLDTQEVRDILNCLTAVDDPSDQPATVGALKSTHFGCSDVDLYEWAKSGGRFSCTSEIPANSKSTAVRDAMEVLRKYHELRDELQPAVLVEQFIRERQARELMFLMPDPAPGLRRIDLVVELVRRFTEEGAASLRDCLTRFPQLKEANDPLREEPSLDFDHGKIRLMTMHASKGLEFPVVILADLCGAGGGGKDPQLIVDAKSTDDGNRKIGVRLGGTKGAYFQNGEYEELLERTKAADELESTRVLYVAATRARDHLIISRYRQERDKKSIATRFEEFVGPSNSLWSPIPQDWASRTFDHVIGPEVPDRSPIVEDRDAWDLRYRNTIVFASEQPWISPSILKAEIVTESSDERDAKHDFTPILDTDEPTGRGRAATKIGSAVHAAVQRCLEMPYADRDQMARNEAERHGVAENVDEIVRLTVATLNMPLVKRAAAMNREDIWVETPVAVPIPTENGATKTIEGRVDLIYRRADGTLGIADFKTDRSFNRSISEMAEPYIPQLGAYAYAVQKATGIPVTEATILFSRLAADNNGGGDYRLPDVQSAIELALKLASTQ